jgi:sulfite exporter TauE/SafE
MLYSALILGLLGSFHCVGMCGPIALVLPVHHHNPIQKFIKITLYHLGRIIAYGCIGVLFGLLGKGLFLSGFQQRLSILIGIGMIVYIVFPSRIFNSIKITQPLYLFIGKLKSSLGKQLKKKSNKALFSIGFLNGFLPCGMVYMALVGAIATANPTEGFLYMAVYGMGTIPFMTVILYAKNIFTVSFRNKIQKAIPYFVVIIGVLFILRGFGIGIPFISPSDAKLQIQSNTKNCVDPILLEKK